MKKISISKILILAFSIFIFSSCSNQEPVQESFELQEIKNISNLKRETSYSTLSELYKNLDKNILNSGNESQISSYIQTKNVEIIDYLVAKYPQYSDATSADTKDLGIFYFGLAHAIAEENGFSNDLSASRIPGWANCAINVVAGYFSIESLIADYVTLFTQGASWNTVWPVVRNFVRRYAGWAIVAFVGYDIATECL